MEYWLLGLHIGLGEIAAFLFLFIGICLFVNTTRFETSLYLFLSKIGTSLIIFSWIIGGYYYLIIYGSKVKPAIKSGSMDWAHLIAMEAKEHIFLFIPLLCIFFTIALMRQVEGKVQIQYKKELGSLSIFIFLLSMSMALMGFIITIGYRVALEGGV
jgi:hypothetical protein